MGNGNGLYRARAIHLEAFQFALSWLVLRLLDFLFRAFHSGPPSRTMTKSTLGLVRGER